MPDNQTARGAFSVDEFCAWASLGRSKFYKEVTTGRLRTRKLGRKTVVLATDAQAWLEALPVAGSREAA